MPKHIGGIKKARKLAGLPGKASMSQTPKRPAKKPRLALILAGRFNVKGRLKSKT